MKVEPPAEVFRARRRSVTARFEEGFEQGFGFSRVDAIVYFRHVVGLGMGEDTRALGDAAGFWIGGCVIKAIDAGRRDGHCAHRAWFERDVKVIAGQAFAV